ncbi:DUF6624 domain-containing protein [Niveibacterium terrae]|uniref:DUF6624 domain-containing protein n=1 Tax=Niveibacterium terrae TaxID=3373598 RepID=UPI003A92BF90
MNAKAVLFCVLSLSIAGAPALAETSSSCVTGLTAQARQIDRQQQTALAEAGEITDPVVRVKAQLAAIRAGDQGIRKAMVDPERKCQPDLKSADWAEFKSLVIGVDARDRDAFKAILASSGWPILSVYGETADQTAFLVVQHADADPEFQRAMLKEMEELVAKKETGRKNFALLFDRVATGQSLPQRYGSQGRCQGEKWEPFAIEAPEGVDARRAEMGLIPLREYREKLTGLFCAPAPEKP